MLIDDDAFLKLTVILFRIDFNISYDKKEIIKISYDEFKKMILQYVVSVNLAI